MSVAVRVTVRMIMPVVFLGVVMTASRTVDVLMFMRVAVWLFMAAAGTVLMIVPGLRLCAMRLVMVMVAVGTMDVRLA